MPNRLRHALLNLDLEEKILNGGAFFAAISVFFPWLSGEWIGGTEETYSGFEFFHAFMGMSIFALFSSIVILTVVPAFGGPVLLKRSRREFIRAFISLLATSLALSALSVLANVTFESTRMEIRFGIYAVIIGGIVTTFYAFLKLQEYLRQEPHDQFRHPDDHAPLDERKESINPVPPPPPPPPPLKPEEHHLR